MSGGRIVAASATWFFLACAGAAPRPPLQPVTPMTLARVPAPSIPSNVEFETPRPRVTRLANGLQIIRVNHPSSPPVAMLVAPRYGTSPFEGLMLHAAVDALGARTKRGVESRVFSAPSFAALEVRSEPEGFAAAIRQLVGFQSQPTFDPESFHASKIDYLQSEVENAFYTETRTRVVARRQMYGKDHVWAQDSRDAIERLQNMQPDVASRLLINRFAHDRSALILVGPESVFPRFQGEEALRVEEARAKPGSLDEPVRSEPRGADWDIGAFWVDTPQTYLRVMHLGPPQSDRKAFAAFVLLAELLGDRTSSPNAELRLREGATYGVRTSLAVRDAVTELFWVGRVANASAVDALVQHRDSIVDAQEGRIDTQALERAKARRRLFDLRLWTTSTSIAQVYATRWSLGLGLDSVESDYDYDHVQASDVRRVAARYLDPRAMVVTVEGKPNTLYRQLSRYGKVTGYQME
ncbi:MAG: hypothetical protein AAFQ65_10435 [Myxococcota bacterium]